MSTELQVAHDHCKCLCARNMDLSTSVIQLDVEDLQQEMEFRNPFDESVIIDDINAMELPEYDHQELDKVIEYQNDEFLVELKGYVKGTIPLPDKRQVVALGRKYKDFLKNKTLFRVSDQDILHRLWVRPDGSHLTLLVLSDKSFMDLLKIVHETGTEY